MQNRQTISLYEAEKRKAYQVASVPDIPLLENMGLRPGANIAVQNRYALGGPALVRVEGAYDLALGKDIAKQIAVKEVVA